MATLKVISTRLKSVTNIQKITKSMKMVSAAKLARAEKELREARPLGEGAQAFFDRIKGPDTQPPTGQVDKNVIVAITSDKGLCGPIHTQLSKAIKTELGSSPGQTKIVCIGDKSRTLLQALYRDNIVLVVNEVGRLPPNFLDASRIALRIYKEEFTSGKIIYNKFNSVVSYTVSKLALLSQSTVLAAPNTHAYDSLDPDITTSYLEFALASFVYFAMKENACSEQASRMTAMENATKNAGEMISLLTLSYNRTRQAMITKELIEIISGASALK